MPFRIAEVWLAEPAITPFAILGGDNHWKPFNPRLPQKQFFLGKLACELWASEKNELRASVIDEFLGKFRTEGILGKAVGVVILAPRGGRSAQSLQQHQQVSPPIVLDFPKTTRPDIG